MNAIMDELPLRQRLEHRLARLDKHIARLEALQARFSWYRLAALAAGGVVVWLASQQFGDTWGRRTFFVALAGFLIVIWLHRRIDKGLEKLLTWKAIREGHLARLRLDWARIPLPPAPAVHPPCDAAAVTAGASSAAPTPSRPPLSAGLPPGGVTVGDLLNDLPLRAAGDGARPGPNPPAPAPRCPLDVDLDLTGERSLHHLLDCAASLQGSRLLSAWLTHGQGEPEAILTRQALARELAPMQHFRDRLALAYRLAAREHLEGEKLLGWLAAPQDAAASAQRLRWALPAAAVWAAVNIALFALEAAGRLPAYWTVSLAFYIAFYYYNIRIFQQTFELIAELDAELPKFGAILRLLERHPLHGKPALQALLKPIRSPKRTPEGGGGQPPSQQLRQLRRITAGVGLRMNPIMGMLLNIVLPWDYLFAWLADRQRKRLAGQLPGWFEALYTLEAAGSLANYAALHPDAAFPEIVEGARPVFEAEGLGHPLIPSEAKVRNDFSVDHPGQIAVITGSNMAGKSTFIKAVGVNLCLAYAGGPVDARRLRALPYRLHACIRISDSIGDGYSYFYAEVRCLKTLLEKLESPGRPVLYLIDEIFKGTNNRERLIGSRAFLRKLMTLNGVGFLATHDLELATLAEESPNVSNFHFRDEVRDGRLAFDYTIHPGPSPTTNALKIMALEGLPAE